MTITVKLSLAENCYAQRCFFYSCSTAHCFHFIHRLDKFGGFLLLFGLIQLVLSNACLLLFFFCILRFKFYKMISTVLVFDSLNVYRYIACDSIHKVN
jgi:hypothetical protein